MKKASLSLPFPPSLNRLYRTFEGKVLLSREGREYYAAMKTLVLTQTRVAFGLLPVAVMVRAYMPDRRKRDLDNLAKVIFDTLQKTGVIVDDANVQLMCFEKYVPTKEWKPEPRVDVFVVEAGSSVSKKFSGLLSDAFGEPR